MIIGRVILISDHKQILNALNSVDCSSVLVCLINDCVCSITEKWATLMSHTSRLLQVSDYTAPRLSYQQGKAGDCQGALGSLHVIHANLLGHVHHLSTILTKAGPALLAHFLALSCGGTLCQTLALRALLFCAIKLYLIKSQNQQTNPKVLFQHRHTDCSELNENLECTHCTEDVTNGVGSQWQIIAPMAP